jgi:ArsR family transcriptional regulator, arsenate/arsenite/antimonite-responsive transcriptional repressor
VPSSRAFVSTGVNIGAISILVNIELHRYHAPMVKSTDPDIQLLAALADPTRMEILRELAGAPEVCACDFTDCCNVSQPTVSHHLKVLRDAGAVMSERRGNWVFYRIAPNLMERLGGIAQTLVPGGAMIQVAALGTRDRAAGRSVGDGVRGQQPAQ